VKTLIPVFDVSLMEADALARKRQNPFHREGPESSRGGCPPVVAAKRGVTKTQLTHHIMNGLEINSG
jgi:hypothetical protein